MNCDNATFMFHIQELLQQILVEVKAFKIISCVFHRRVKQSFQSKNSMRLTCTISSFYPYILFLLTVKHTHYVLYQFYKGLVRIKFLPKLRITLDNVGIDRWEIIGIYVKIVFILHNYFKLEQV